MENTVQWDKYQKKKIKKWRTVQWDKYKKKKKIHTYCQHHDPSLQIFCSKVLFFSMGKRVLFVSVVQLPPPRCDTEQPLCCSGQVSFIWKRHLPHSFTFVHAGCHNNVITLVLCFCVEMSFVSSLSYTAHISLKAFSNIPLSITINLCWRINTPPPPPPGAMICPSLLLIQWL